MTVKTFFVRCKVEDVARNLELSQYDWTRAKNDPSMVEAHFSSETNRNVFRDLYAKPYVVHFGETSQ